MESLIEFLTKLSPGFFFEDPRAVESPVYLFVLGLFVVALIAGLIAVVFADRFSGDNRLARQVFDRYGRWAAWVGALGILAVGLRYTHVALFSKRMWTVLDLIILFAVVGHLIWYLRINYAADLAAYQDAERRRRFAAARRPAPRRSTRRQRA